MPLFPFSPPFRPPHLSLFLVCNASWGIAVTLRLWDSKSQPVYIKPTVLFFLSVNYLTIVNTFLLISRYHRNLAPLLQIVPVNIFVVYAFC